MAFPLTLGHIALACRVVYTSESDARWSFANGTQHHHLESGEELFQVSRDTDDRVRFTVMAYSRPGHLVTAVGAPVARRMQHAATLRYVQAMKDLLDPISDQHRAQEQ